MHIEKFRFRSRNPINGFSLLLHIPSMMRLLYLRIFFQRRYSLYSGLLVYRRILDREFFGHLLVIVGLVSIYLLCLCKNQGF